MACLLFTGIIAVYENSHFVIQVLHLCNIKVATPFGVYIHVSFLVDVPRLSETRNHRFVQNCKIIYYLPS
jgi:hypothetical protein